MRGGPQFRGFSPASGREIKGGGGWAPTERETTTEGVSSEFRISLADERRDYFKEIRNYLISGEKSLTQAKLINARPKNGLLFRRGRALETATALSRPSSPVALLLPLNVL